MQSRVSYAAVGAFVVLLSIALVGAGLWLGSGSYSKPYEHYSIYFRESVSGLNRNAPVKYKGVVVGRVDSVQLDPDNPERVLVQVGIEDGTPVKTDTRARLDPQGITGIVHIELTGGTKGAPLLESSPGERYPVIPTAPSLISRLDQALTKGLDTLDKLAGQVSELAGPENQRSLQATLKNLETFSATLANNSERINRTLALAEQTLAGSAKAAEQLPNALADLQQTLDKWNRLSDNLADTSTDVKKAANIASRELGDIGRDTMPQVNQLIADLRQLSASLTRLSEELRENPRMLLFGRPDEAPGPGE